MIFDFILVFVLTVIFLLFTVFRKEKKSGVKKDFAREVSRAAVLSGTFITVLKLIVLVDQLETFLNSGFSEGSRVAAISDSSKFFIMFFIRLRPLFAGLLFRLFAEPFIRKSSNKIDLTESEQKMVQMQKDKEQLQKIDFSKLSVREKAVAQLAAKGFSNAQIAEELFISVETVKRHMSTIFEKLNIKSRKDLSVAAETSGD